MLDRTLFRVAQVAGVAGAVGSGAAIHHLSQDHEPTPGRVSRDEILDAAGGAVVGVTGVAGVVGGLMALNIADLGQVSDIPVRGFGDIADVSVRGFGVGAWKTVGVGMGVGALALGIGAGAHWLDRAREN